MAILFELADEVQLFVLVKMVAEADAVRSRVENVAPVRILPPIIHKFSLNHFYLVNRKVTIIVASSKKIEHIHSKSISLT